MYKQITGEERTLILIQVSGLRNYPEAQMDIYKHFIVPIQFTRHWRLEWVMMEWQMIPRVRPVTRVTTRGRGPLLWSLHPDKDLLWSWFLTRVLSLVAAEWIIMNKREMIMNTEPWATAGRVSISSPGSSASNNRTIVGAQLICFVKIIGQQFLGFHRTETSLALQKYKTAEILIWDALYW